MEDKLQSDPIPAQEALDRRESLVALRERKLLAREEIVRRKLPLKLLDSLDLASDEALSQSLSLAENLFLLARTESAQAQTPKVCQPSPQAKGNAGYARRAALYQSDRESYTQLYGGKDTWTQQ